MHRTQEHEGNLMKQRYNELHRTAEGGGSVQHDVYHRASDKREGQTPPAFETRF